MEEERRKVYGWLVRDRNAAVGCSSMWADTRGGENYCGNLLWQSSLTLLSPDWNLARVLSRGAETIRVESKISINALTLRVR